MAPRTRFFEECPEDDCLEMLEELEEFASAPLDDVREISDRLKADRERVMRKWNHFFKEQYTKKQVDPEEIWLGLCRDDDQAKFYCKVFLQWYVKKSGRWEVCLGPAEYEWKREVTSAITLTEAWKRLVVEAHSTVLFRKRKEDRVNRRQWGLSFAEKGTGPVAEISRWIAGPLSRQLGLTTEQTFEKQQTSPEDIALFLDTLWNRSADIPLTASTRIACHTFMLVAGIGGFRNGSILNLPYKQVRLALVRDPDRPSSPKLVGHILIVQNKRRKGLRHTQDDNFLVARALADNAFEAGYQTFEELLEKPLLEPGIDYLPLPFKEDILDRRIIPLGQEKLNEIWNRILLVAGLRQSMKPYSLRVGAAGRLNGVLEPTLRNYILSQSSSVFHHSYQPRRFDGDLAFIAFGGLGGDSGDTKLFQLLSNSSLSRDERAPVNSTTEDLAECEMRNDIQKLRKAMRESADQGARDRISKRIANIVKSWSRLKVQERRKAYFTAADQRRGQGLSTDDLGETSTAMQSPATRVGQFLRFEETSQHRNSSPVGKLLLGFLQNRLSPLSEEASIASSESKAAAEADQSGSKPDAVSTCLLCRETCANRSSLTRHHKRKHLSTAFQQPFSCPECQRLQVNDHVIDSAPAWSNHVETYHGKNNAPNLPKTHQIWHAGATPDSRQVWCLICSKPFHPGSGFALHLKTHKDAKVFAQPFQCIEYPKSAWINSLSEWVDHSARIHGGCPRSGATTKKPRSATKRTSDNELIDDRSAKKFKVKAGQRYHAHSKLEAEDGQGYEAHSLCQLDDFIPIDPALLDS